jgi:hypothetical protein
MINFQRSVGCLLFHTLMYVLRVSRYVTGTERVNFRPPDIAILVIGIGDPLRSAVRTNTCPVFLILST